MRISALSIGLFCLLHTTSDVRSQGPGAVPATVMFRNDTKTPVIVQGTSTVGGMIRRGQPVLVAPGRVAGDFNLPPGARLYSVYDANQPVRVLAKDVPIGIPTGANLLVSIRPVTMNQVALVAEATARP